MSDPKPNLEGPSPTGSSIVSDTRLEATNSQIGNAAQIVASPGAVLNQNITQVQASPGLRRTELIFWALIALAVLVAASRATVEHSQECLIGSLGPSNLLGKACARPLSQRFSLI